MGIDPFSAMAAATALDAAGSMFGQRLALQRQHQGQDFSEQMFRSRYQMTVEDLKRAGLNPMLAYSSGAGGQPSGSAASAASPQLGQTAMAARMNSAQVANVEADTENKIVQNQQIQQQTDLMATTAELQATEIAKVTEEIKNVKQQYENLQAQWMKDTSDAKLKDAMVASEQWYQRLVEKQERLLMNQIQITNPQANAAATTGAFAAHGENISKGLKPVTDIIDFKTRSKSNKYPKQVGD